MSRSKQQELSEADKLKLVDIESKLRVHWDAPPPVEHVLVQEYYTCAAFSDYRQCREELLHLHTSTDAIDEWRFAIRGARLLALNKANRVERKNAGVTTANIKIEFSRLNFPFQLSTLYNRTNPWTYALDKRLNVLMLIITEYNFSFVAKHSTKIRDIVNQVANTRETLVLHNGLANNALQLDQRLQQFIDRVPFSERKLPQHRPQ